VRILASVTFIIETIFYNGIVIYAPALALNAGKHILVNIFWLAFEDFHNWTED